MKLFNISMVLNWARKENDRRGCKSVFIKKAEDEFAALLKINESQKTDTQHLKAKISELEEDLARQWNSKSSIYIPNVISELRKLQAVE